MPNLIFILGPPAVGKMTVGQEISRRLDYPLFHNHISIEATLGMFAWGTPEFKKINSGIRDLVFETAANSPTLEGFIFTVVTAFDLEEDVQWLYKIRDQFQAQGWSVFYLELTAPLAIRLARNKTPNRLAHKASKRKLERSHNNILEMEDQYQMNTEAGLDEPDYLLLDNSDLSAAATAQIVINRFELK